MRFSKIPVYMINGFLESGKSEFIKYTITQPYFRSKGTTLLILCEEGEIEFEEEVLASTNTVLEVIDDRQDFNKDKLSEISDRVNPSRIIIEFNGMWNPKEIVLPSNWSIEQQITTIDASTFSVFYNNMKSLVGEQVRNSDMIIFNRCDGIDNLANFKRSVKAVNSSAEVIFEDKDGELNVSLDEELPFDLNADVIKLDDTGYAIWFIDISDNLERYDGKTIEFVGMVAKPPMFDDSYFVPGRMAMTCCEDDMAFLGYACKFKDAKHLAEKTYVRVNATIKIEELDAYQGVGPVLYANSVTTVKAPKTPVIDFSNL